MTFPIEPLYDVNRSYEDNYRHGPFSSFAAALDGPDDGPGRNPQGHAAVTAQSNLLGLPVGLPFGIPAGPLLNSRFTTAAFRMGFDLAVYKTVRSRYWPCNPFPNVLAVHPTSPDGTLDPLGDEAERGVLADEQYDQPVSISNSFGVPSRSPDEWQPDMSRAVAAAGPGQLLIASFQGSRVAGMDERDYIDDHVRAAGLVLETGARIIEMNTSCPNEGLHRLLCDDPHLVGRITEAVKEAIGDVPLVIKLAYIPTNEALELMVRETAGRGTVQGFTAINTISARLIDSRGRQALAGDGREHSGVCGHAIRPAGLDMVSRLNAIRSRLGLDFSLIGVGGVASARDYDDYRAAGADAVMSATGAMWNPELAHEIRRHVEHAS